MPIATNQSVIMEESHHKSVIYPGEELEVVPPRTDFSFLEEIEGMFEKIKFCQKEEEAFRKKIEQVERSLEVANEMISKAQAKRDALLERNKFLMGRLEDRTERIRNAVQYWKSYGFDVKQVSNKSDSFEQYEFKYTKLPAKRAEKSTPAPSQDQQQQQQLGGDNHTTNNSLHHQQRPKTSTCSVSLKYQDKVLVIIEHAPEILMPEDLLELNTRLTANCVNPDNGHVDYKLAMIMIRKDLIKALNSCPTTKAAPSEDETKTCEHQPAETNSHNCT